jgi:hypothetical protein
VGKIGNTTVIPSEVSSGIGLVLPSQLNSAMTIEKTIPFQAIISLKYHNLIGASLLPREGQSLPPRYNDISL